VAWRLDSRSSHAGRVQSVPRSDRSRPGRLPLLRLSCARRRDDLVVVRDATDVTSDWVVIFMCAKPLFAAPHLTPDAPHQRCCPTRKGLWQFVTHAARTNHHAATNQVILLLRAQRHTATYSGKRVRRVGDTR